MSGKHYRAPAAEPQRRSAEPQRTPARTQAPEKTKADEYEDLYSYEEPYGAKRGTRQAKNRKPSYEAYAPQQKKSAWPPVIATLCLLAALGILFYIVWDLGVLSMISSLLG